MTKYLAAWVIATGLAVLIAPYLYAAADLIGR